MNHKAIFELYPQVKNIDGETAYDADGKEVAYNKDAVQAYVDAHAYIAKRAAEYPNITDFADAYYWMQKGKTELMDAYVAKCEEIKLKYPK